MNTYGTSEFPGQGNDPLDYSVSGESPLDHHKRRTPYRSKSGSRETSTQLADKAWAMSMRSKGSRWEPGNAPARAASSTVIGSSLRTILAIDMTKAAPVPAESRS